MSSRGVFVMSLVSVLMLVAMSANAAQVKTPQSVASAAGPQAIAAPPTGNAAVPMGVRAATQQVTVMVELTDEPAIKAYLKTRAAARAEGRSTADAETGAVKASRSRIAAIESKQTQIIAAIRSRAASAQVLYGVQRTFNGVVVRLPAAQAMSLAKIDGVKSVRPMRPATIENSTSVPFINAPAIWTHLSGYTGSGVKLGILDTGVDYIHKSLGGSGAAGSYSSNDTTNPSDIADYPNAKVVGGTDLVGDAYDGYNAAVPDSDPMDARGHGSHVAGSAGGWGVLSDGSVPSAPWTGALPFSTMRVGPGVAPDAQIYAIKIFGASGSTFYVVQGVEWCADPDGNGDYSDRMDVVNCSVGSPFGNEFEPDTIAMNTAVELGVFFACSAGNSGDTFFVNGSPGIASRAISTAASLDTYSATALLITAPAGIAGNYPCQPSGIAPALTSTGITGNIVLAEPANASTALTNAAAMAGNIALIDRGTVNYVTKVRNAQAAGAIGVIVANNSGDGLVNMVLPDGDNGADVTIPSIFIGQSTGNTIKGQLPGVTCAMNTQNEISDPTQADTLASFSSRGPAGTNTALKPDIAAPGYSIQSVGRGTGTEAARMGGTSMASPHVAGAAACLRQMHPTWSCEEIKALLMNSASHLLYTGSNYTTPTYVPSRVGVGRLDLANAAALGAIAYCTTGDPGAVSLSYGAPEVPAGTVQSWDHTVTVADKGIGAATFLASYSPVFDVAGVDVSFPDGTTVNVPAGGSATFRVRVTATADQLRHMPDPAMLFTQSGYNRNWMSEENGHVILTQQTGLKNGVPPSLWLSLYAAPRPASSMTTTQTDLNYPGASGTLNLSLTGTPVNTGSNYPYDIQSCVIPFELMYMSPDDALTTGAYNAGDIKHVGINISGTDPATVVGGNILFGVTTWGNHYSPSIAEVDVFIDSDRNGSWDYVLYSANYGSAYVGDPTDTYVSILYSFSTGYVNGWPGPDQYDFWGNSADMRPFNSNCYMLILPDAANIGMSPSQSQFDFQVAVYGMDGTLVDQTSKMTYDLAAAGITFGPYVAYFYDNPANTIPCTYDQTNIAANASLGVLLQHRHNALGARSQILLPTGTGTPTPTATPTGVIPTPTPTSLPPTPTPQAYFPTAQACQIVSDGIYWVAAWDYGLSNWSASLETTGAGQLSFNLNKNTWVGIFLYDYNSLAWEEGMYVYSTTQ